MGEDEDKKKKEDEDAAKKQAEQNSSNIIEEARKVNEEKARLIEEEKKLMDRKEKFHAEQMVGGGSQAGQPAEKDRKDETNKEYRTRIEKEMSEGKTEFGD